MSVLTIRAGHGFANFRRPASCRAASPRPIWAERSDGSEKSQQVRANLHISVPEPGPQQPSGVYKRAPVHFYGALARETVVKRVAILVVSVFGINDATVAQDVFPWGEGEIAGWGVYVDTSRGGGCFLYTHYEGDTGFRLGYDRTENSNHLILENPNWRSIRNGKEYAVSIRFGKKEPWVAMGVGSAHEDIYALTFDIADTAFLEEFSSQYFFSAKYEGHDLGIYNLKGSSQALKEMNDCQQTINSADGVRTADKFAIDPFYDPADMDGLI